MTERERENVRQSEADVKVGHKFVIDASSSDNYEFAFNSKKNNKQTDREADRAAERERQRRVDKKTLVKLGYLNVNSFYKAINNQAEPRQHD